MDKSLGHIAFHDGAEYFECEGEVYRAQIDNPLDVKGRRFGRWECSRAHFDRYRKLLDRMPSL